MELNVINAYKDPYDLYHNSLTLPLSPAFGGEGGVRGWGLIFLLTKAAIFHKRY
jgi:hypothetical protein